VEVPPEPVPLEAPDPVPDVAAPVELPPVVPVDEAPPEDEPLLEVVVPLLAPVVVPPASGPARLLPQAVANTATRIAPNLMVSTSKKSCHPEYAA
jgi:hypothetical protein